MKEHPLHETHVLRIRKHEAIPIIYGDKLQILTDNSSSIEKEQNSKIALVLYRPFRNAIADLKGDHSTWYDSFKDWQPPADIKQLMTNAYDLHIARKRAGEIAKESRLESGDNNSDCSSDEDRKKR